MKLRNVVVMLVLSALCALAYFLMKDAGDGGVKLPATMPAFLKEDVKKIVLAYGGKELTLRRSVERSDAWDVDAGIATLRADATAVDELLSQLSRQDVRTRYPRVGMNDGDIKGYGLDVATAQVILTVPKGDITVRYGKKTREATGTYVDTGDGTDVWVVGGGVVEEIVAVMTSGAKSKRFTDLRLYDIGKLEIVKGSVTALEASRDASQIWRISQPFKGFADPSEFEHELDRLVNTEVVDWVDVGAQDLTKYGLDKPRAEVRLTHKKGGEPFVLLVGGVAGKDGVFVMEKGRPNVAMATSRFREGVDVDVATLRDHSFTRIGIDGSALRVKIGQALYELRKEGSSWDVTAPDRFPGDDNAVRDAMELVRSWRTSEFLDGVKPAEFGIDDTSDFVEIDLQGGGKTTLVFGKEATGNRRYAMRKNAEGESGVELVDAAPLERLAGGYPQFRRKVVRDFSSYMGDLERVSRDSGKSDEGQKVQTVVIERDTVKAGGWALSSKLGPGLTGTLDPTAVSRLLGALPTIVASDWLFWSIDKNDEMGLTPGAPETFSIVVKFSAKTGTPPDGDEQILLVGKRHPKGGYYAKFGGDRAWAFVLSAEDATALTVPLAK